MAELYADIIVNITNGRLDRTFQYRVPGHIKEDVKEGTRVRVPFGNSTRRIEGYVISLGNEPKVDPGKIKDIEAVYENAVTVEARLVKLASWMRMMYGSTMIQALKTVLPVREKMKVPEARTIRLVLDEQEAEELSDEFGRKRCTAKQRLLCTLISEGEISWERAVKELKAAPSMIRQFEEAGIAAIDKTAAYRKPFLFGDVGGGGDPDRTDNVNQIGNADRADDVNHPGNPDHPGRAAYTDEQQACIENILKEWQSDAPRPCLIHGVTGSGKTVVYMDLIERVLAQGRQAILLIPEIALTWQTFGRFYRRFGDSAALLNSRMSAGERSDLLERVEKKEVSLVIGPRSALFTPFPDLGLIIIDEEHEDSYKSELSPRYHARETAIERARIENARVVMGSATPSLEAVYGCEQGIYRYLTLKKRYGGAPLPVIEVVDMKQELKNGNQSVISSHLAAAIGECLKNHEQIMLFLNRRGYSGNFTCRSCGHVIKCPHCDVSLTLHNDGRLKCHYCGYSEKAAAVCPSCGSPHIGGMSIGTQQAEAQLLALFPDASVLRMDRDTTGGKYDHERILQSFKAREADILIGTQMIAKGHDFANVTLVGILSADTSLYAGDYRAAEKTYELLTQAAGRAGRGDRPGRAVIQTYHPDHYVIEAVTRQKYSEFYSEEAANRGLLSYPPFGHILGIHASCPDEKRLEAAVKHIRIFLEQTEEGGRSVIMGPGQELIYKIQDVFRMVLYIKNSSTETLVRLRRLTERYIEINRGFETVAVQFDMDA